MSGFMKRMKSVAVVVSAVGLSAVPLAGQGVESILRERESLALTEEQVSSLDAIRREIVSERAAEEAEMSELRSRLAAGMIQRSEVMAAEEDRQAAAEGRIEERRARIDAVLTAEQRTSVEQMRTRVDRVRGQRQGVAPGGRGGFGRGALGRGALGRDGIGRGGIGPGGFGPGGRGRRFGPR